MNLETIYLLIKDIALILGTIGGVPQIIRWLQRKPTLEISDIEMEAPPNIILSFSIWNAKVGGKRLEVVKQQSWVFLFQQLTK